MSRKFDMKECNNCARKCKNGAFCGKVDGYVRVAKVMRHCYEEPIICPKDVGCGAVFFSHCNLKCVYCQNYKISHEGVGRDLTVEQLADIFRQINISNVATLDLVSPTHYAKEIVEALKLSKVNIPVVWNSGGYDSIETIKSLRGYVDIFLFDIKYFSDESAIRYSSAKGYFDTCLKAIKEARKIVGQDEYDDKGNMKKGIILRHLVLPNNSDDSIKIFERLKEEIGTDVCISLMSQYYPCYKAKDYAEINTKLKPLEYKKVLLKVRALGFNNGFVQDSSSADCKYTPNFEDNFFDL